MIVTAYDFIRRETTARCTSCGEELCTVTDEELVRSDSPADLASALQTAAAAHTCKPKDPT
jgi:hypothetical protein